MAFRPDILFRGKPVARATLVPGFLVDGPLRAEFKEADSFQNGSDPGGN